MGCSWHRNRTGRCPADSVGRSWGFVGYAGADHLRHLLGDQSSAGSRSAAKGRELRGPENAAADGTPEPPQEQEFADKIQDFLQKVQQQADRQTVAGKEQTPEVLEAEIVDPVDVEVATVISPPQAAHGWDQTDEFQSTATLRDRLPRTVMPTVNPQMEQPQQEVFDHQIGNLSPNASRCR